MNDLLLHMAVVLVIVVVVAGSCYLLLTRTKAGQRLVELELRLGSDQE